MAIDPSIPLSVRGPAINTPFESLGSMMQLQHQQQQMRASQSLEEERRQQIAKQQKQEADEEAYRQTITATAALPPDQIRSAIAQHAPQHLAAFDKEAADLADKAAVTKEHKATAAKSEQDYIGKAADAMRQAQGDPVVMNFVLNRTVEHFPEWAPHADELRHVALTQGKEGFLKTLDALTPADIAKQRAEGANATAELPGKTAQAAVQQQVAAGTVGGLTPEQQAQNANAAATAATARGQLGVAQGRLGVEQARLGIEQTKAAKGKPLTQTEADKISDITGALRDLDSLRVRLSQPGSVGPSAAFGAHLPNIITSTTGLGAEAKSTQADIDRTRQTIARMIHGGVLRANDQVQAEKFLPVIGDAESVKNDKIAQLQAMITSRLQDHLGNLGKAGYDVSNFTAADTAAAPATLAAGKVQRVVQNGVTYDVATDPRGKVISSKVVP
jgi:hypothetical protein